MTKKVCEILDSNSYDLIWQVYDDDAYQKKKKKQRMVVNAIIPNIVDI